MRNFIIILVFSLLCACADHDGTVAAQPETQSAEIEITMNIPVVGVRTRALTDQDEMSVSTVDILVFKEAVGGTETFSERVIPTAIMLSGSEQSVKAYITPDNTNRQKLVIIANARTLVESLLSSFTGLGYDDAMDLIVMSHSGAWKTTTGDYDPIPMWGETEYILVSGTSSTPIASSVDMMRALARIDVALSDEAADDFTMTAVHVYNTYAAGRIVPTSLADWQSMQVSLPSGTTANQTVVYDQMTTSDTAIEQVIYTFEAPAAAGNTDTGGVCLIIAGEWDGNSTSYYRVDFIDEATGGFMPLLRNYFYDVRITEVSGDGYATIEEALEAGFSNMTAVTHFLDDSLGNSVVWDGRNWLSVTTTTYDLYRSAAAETLSVATNYYGADMVIEVTEGGDWLLVDGVTQVTEAPSDSINSFDITITTTENNSGDVRSGTIVVTAGRLSQTISVTQKNTNSLNLVLGDIELIFPAAEEYTNSLRIEWEPAELPCSIAVMPVDGYSPVDIQPSFATSTSTGGTYSLSITSDIDADLAVFSENRSILRVTVSDSSDPLIANTIYKDVLLRQFNYAIVISGEQTDYNFGTTYDFTVRANTTWRVASYSDQLTLASTVVGQADTSTGETIAFTTTSDETYAGTTVSFTLVSTIDPNISVTVEMPLRKVYPNSYIVRPGSTGVLPLAKPYYVWKNDSDLGVELTTSSGSLSAELVWQDTPGLITAVSVDAAGDLQDGTVNYSVASGLTGNAVIAFMIDGDIHWSWHIWVLDSDPDSKYNSYLGLTVMDRYLGALSASPTDSSDAGVYGYYYQHGRKDPFPGPSIVSTSDTGSKPIYNFSGTQLSEGDETATGVKKVAVAETSNMINAIRNPLTYYFGSAQQASASPAQNDWYTSGLGSLHRMDLWGPGYKTEFDPCPGGWKVPDTSEFIFANEVYSEELKTQNYIEFTDIGYYMAQGSRSDTNGNIVNRNSIRLWLADPSVWGRSQYTLISTTSLLNTVSQNAMGTPVRCVKVR